ncbi:MAG: DUF5011 domain-containing protein [Tenericutes bacterium]|nr:DUF5011 domain-containing protein [Mycoplasmatota bacterium]
MFNKKRLFVFAVFLVFLFFMWAFGSSPNEPNKINTRTVMFIDSITNTVISNQTIEVGKDAKIPDEPIHDGCNFVGWYTEGDVKTDNFTNITSDITVYSKCDWKYFKVTFYDTVSKSNIDTQSVKYGEDAIAPAIPTHANYSFDGWSREYVNVKSNITVNAVYRSTVAANDVVFYDVVFLLDDKELSSQKIRSGLTATAPVAPKLDKKVFVGWDSSFSNITKNTRVFAIYKDDLNENGIADDLETKFTVSFIAGENGSLVGTLTFDKLLSGLNFYDNVTVPDKVANEGYTFIEWNPTLPESDALIVNSDVTYEAVFKDITAPVIENVQVIKNLTNENTIQITGKVYDANLKNYNLRIYDKDKKLVDSINGITVNENKEGTLGTFDISNLTDGQYFVRIWADDLSGNRAGISSHIYIPFTIDRTSPVIQINDKDPVNFYNNNVKVTASDENGIESLVVTRNGKNVSNLNNITKEGIYTATATDKAGNTTIVEFTIDKTAPVILANNLPLLLHIYFNKNVTITATDKNLDKVTINGEVYNNEKITVDGKYTVVATDKAGNSTTRTFTIDKTAPIIKINGETPKEFYNIDTKVTAEEDNLLSLLIFKKGSLIPLKNPIKEEGTYTAIATDKAGNITSITWTIDKTDPIIKINDNNPVKYYNVDANVTASDKNLKDLIIKVKDTEIVVSNFVTEEGRYIATATDKAGNTTTAEFTIDKTDPVIKVKDESIGSKDLKIFSNVSFQLHDSVGVLYTLLNGVKKEYTVNKWSDLNGVKPGKFGAVEGKNVLILFDVAGNSVTYEFTLDTIAPDLAINLNRTHYIVSGQIVSKISKPEAETKAKDIARLVIYKEDGSQFTEWTNFNPNNSINYKGLSWIPDGTYSAVAYDHAKNASEKIEFIMDSTSPIAKIVTPDIDGKKFGKDVTVIGEVDSIEKNINSHWFEIINPDGTLNHSMNMNTSELSYSFKLDTSKGSGTYKLRYVATDKVGNRSDDPNFTNSVIRTIEVDAVNPTTTINVSPVSNGNNFTISGHAIDDQRLNRVYVQLINRTTGARCGGTTIHLLDPDQKEADWSRKYFLPEMKLDPACNSTGNYAAHVEVVDFMGNRGSAGWTEDFYLDFTDPTTTLEVSEVVNGEFTVSGIATDNYALNYAYLQIVNKDTNKYCGETFYPIGTSYSWSKTFNATTLGECYSNGRLAAHISVTDQFGNSTTQGWTEDFNYKIEEPTTPVVPKLSINYVYYKNDREELSWTTGTDKDNPTTAMRIRFRVIADNEVVSVRALWTNSFNSVVSHTDLHDYLMANPDSGVELGAPDSNGYYYTNSPEGIEGRWLAGLVAVDSKGYITAWSGYSMYFEKPIDLAPDFDLSYTSLELIEGEKFTEPIISNVTDDKLILTASDVKKEGTVNPNHEGTYTLTYSLSDGVNTTTKIVTVIVKPLLINLTSNIAGGTSMNSISMVFTRDFVVTKFSQIKINYKYRLDGIGDFKYHEFSKTLFYGGMLNQGGKKILHTTYFEDVFAKGTILKDLPVTHTETKTNTRMKDIYEAKEAGRQLELITVMTITLENGAKVVYEFPVTVYNKTASKSLNSKSLIESDSDASNFDLGSSVDGSMGENNATEDPQLGTPDEKLSVQPIEKTTEEPTNKENDYDNETNIIDPESLHGKELGSIKPLEETE